MRILLFSAVVAAAICVTVAGPAKTLPSTWTTCRRSDPKVSQCFGNAANYALKELAEKGAKDLGVYRIDPLAITELGLPRGNGPVAIDLTFKDAKVHGLKEAHLSPFEVHPDQYRFKTNATFGGHDVTIKGNYKIDGKVLVLPITGEGKCELTLENPTAEVELIGKERKKDGQIYMEVEEFGFKLSTSRLRMNFENLFNGNKQLSDTMNVFINENWADIFKELRPSIEQGFGLTFKDISNRIFTKIPYEKLLPK